MGEPRLFRAYLPEHLDFDAVTRPEWRAYGAWVVSAVLFRRFVDRAADEDTFVPLAAAYINAHIPPRVRGPLMADLARHGVLECDNKFYFARYADGKRGKCMCYRLGPAHRGNRIVSRPVDHPELLRKLEAAHADEREAITDEVHLALRRWHDQVEVTADAPRGEHPLLDRMMDGERRFTVCDQGRIHTNVANLPAQCRQFIRLAGHELASVDIATSQPLILGIFLREGPKGGRAEGGEEDQAIYSPCSDPSLSVYLADCLAGSVYDRIAGETGLARDAVKSMFLAVIYGHPEHMDTKVGRAVRGLYPAVFNAVVEANFRLGHGGLPRLMQRLESGVMIGRVAARLVREDPDMPILTVHDSVLVPEQYVARVELVIREEWKAEFDLVPKAKVSDWTAPQEARSKKSRRKGRKREWPTGGIPVDLGRTSSGAGR